MEAIPIIYDGLNSQIIEDIPSRDLNIFLTPPGVVYEDVVQTDEVLFNCRIYT
jgi:hypothetical protein